MPRGEIDTEPIRILVEKSGLTCYEIARRCGFMRTHHQRRAPDPARVQRILGIKPMPGSHGKRVMAKGMKYEHALRFAEALDIDPVDIGL